MGYDLERFVGYVNEGLLCSVCQCVCEDAVMSPCEHVFCSECIRAWLSQHSSCPEDRTHLTHTHLRPLYRYMRNDLMRLQIRCVFHTHGCDVISTLESIRTHEAKCDYVLLNCTNAGCEVAVCRRDLEAHMCVCAFSGTNETHASVAKLRTELQLLRTESLCKVEELRCEMESRLDSQRRHMVQREGLMKNELEQLKSQLSRVMTDVCVLLAAQRSHQEELEKAELEKAELLKLLKKGDQKQATPTHGEGLLKPSPLHLILDTNKRKNKEVSVI
ncbi:E3 ubiquitin-protein ligase NRDP1 isoform X2 [Denticeps clupeoides]|uniref:RING-type domain-containing protein n=1 Tax=Denticeps clupeoides TaxID=299321 RepID=A0AAY4DKR1_9TELE|nr:E3 ubiquitin-protein ligase NRDP1-like isoform X2 [Denticeps clupeoides]